MSPLFCFAQAVSDNVTLLLFLFFFFWGAPLLFAFSTPIVVALTPTTSSEKACATNRREGTVGQKRSSYVKWKRVLEVERKDQKPRAVASQNQIHRGEKQTSLLGPEQSRASLLLFLLSRQKLKGSARIGHTHTHKKKKRPNLLCTSHVVRYRGGKRIWRHKYDCIGRLTSTYHSLFGSGHRHH